MKARETNRARSILRRFAFALCCCAGAAVTLVAPAAIAADETAKTFATPDEATSALTAAVKNEDGPALRAIFGPDISEIENPDRVQATNEFKTFAAALDQGVSIIHDSDTRCELEIGTNSWPFPIPIVQRDGKWVFDTEQGIEELLNRRIGKNELEALDVVRGYVDAQREYATKDRDGDEVLEYAQRIASSAGKKDGLYWPPELDGEISPMGPLVAEAQTAGYFGDSPVGRTSPQPFHGYLFRILTAQGEHAPGGKYNYVINGNMIAGFALVAWPASYGDSGIMTFIVNQQGRVYQKDLGEKTDELAPAIKEYDPDSTWQVSPD